LQQLLTDGGRPFAGNDLAPFVGDRPFGGTDRLACSIAGAEPGLVTGNVSLSPSVGDRPEHAGINSFPPSVGAKTFVYTFSPIVGDRPSAGTTTQSPIDGAKPVPCPESSSNISISPFDGTEPASCLESCSDDSTTPFPIPPFDGAEPASCLESRSDNDATPFSIPPFDGTEHVSCHKSCSDDSTTTFPISPFDGTEPVSCLESSSDNDATPSPISPPDGAQPVSCLKSSSDDNATPLSITPSDGTQSKFCFASSSDNPILHSPSPIDDAEHHIVSINPTFKPFVSNSTTDIESSESCLVRSISSKPFEPHLAGTQSTPITDTEPSFTNGAESNDQPFKPKPPSPTDAVQSRLADSNPQTTPFSAGTYPNSPIAGTTTHFGIAVILTLMFVHATTFVKGGDKWMHKCVFCGRTNKQPHSPFCSSFCSLEEARRLHRWHSKAKPHDPFANLKMSHDFIFEGYDRIPISIERTTLTTRT
jgi:hypothetical protein